MDPGTTSLLRCEGTAPTCPKVSSVLVTLVGGSRKVLLSLSGASMVTVAGMWAAFLGKLFPVGGALKRFHSPPPRPLMWHSGP